MDVAASEELALIRGASALGLLLAHPVPLTGQLQKLDEQKRAALAREEYSMTHRIKVKSVAPF